MNFRKFRPVLFALPLLAVSAFAQPKLKVLPEQTFDIGDYFKGQKAEHTLTVKNVGNDTLKITEVKTQCGCTATMMSDKVLAPSQEGKLSITFDTHAYMGKVTKQVYLTSNDPAAPRTTIQFTANVMEVLTVSPQMIVFDSAVAGHSMTKTVTLTNPSQKTAIKILSVDANSENMKATLMKMQLMPGEQTQLQAELNADKGGSYNGAIVLKTDNPMSPTISIQYNALVHRK